MTIRLCFVAIAASLATPTVSPGATVAFDNTNSGALALSGGNQLYEDGTYRKAIVFTTPVGTDVRLSEFRFGFQGAAIGAQLNLLVDLQAVNGFNAPTGPALANLSTTVILSTAPNYFTLNLDSNPGSTFDNYTLSAGTTYALVTYAAGPGGATGPAWNVALNTAPTAANGFAFLDFQRSFDSGATWSSSTTRNAVAVGFTPVPEPSSLLGLLIGGLWLSGWAGHRRTGRARRFIPC